MIFGAAESLAAESAQPASPPPDSSAEAFLKTIPDRDPSKFSDDPPALKELAPVPLAQLDASVLRGVQFLLRSQNRDGSWGLPIHTKKLNIYAPDTAHDGYRSGTTALALESLLRVERMLQEGDALPNSDELPKLKAILPEITSAIDRCEKWMFENMPKLKRSAPDVLYSNWGHAYGMSTFRLMFERKFPEKPLAEAERTARQERIREAIRYQIHMLVSDECLAGGWCYYDMEFSAGHPSASTLCFLTATVLVGLADARECGIEIPPKLIERAKDSILRQRRPNGAFAYGEYTINRAVGINHSAASLGRSQVCHLALGLWGDSKIATQQQYADWLSRMIARIGWLDIGRKRPVPHESWFSVAGYFYYYAHYYAARVVDELEDARLQQTFSNHLTSILLGLQEKDGSWWDYPLYDYHPYYGTGMAVATLIRCRAHLSESPQKTE